jgi:hypothetical protein
LLTIPWIATWNVYRDGIQPGFADTAALLTSVGMLAFTVAYLATRPEQAVRTAHPAAIRAAARTLDWKWLTAACIPLAALTYQGRGYNEVGGIGAASSVGTDLAATFFVIIVALAASGFLLRHGVRWFIPVLVIQSAMLAAAGERTPIITDAIAVILIITLADSRPRARQLWGAAAIALAAILAITGFRVQQGRSLFYQDSGLSARLSALGSGIVGANGPSATEPAGPGLLAQAVIRTDGTDFAAGILQSVSLGQPRLAGADAAESLLIVIPSSLWPSKLSRATLNPAALETGDFGLRQANLLPTLPGLYTGYLSPPWLLAFLALTGLLCGLGERWLFRRFTPARLVFLAGAVTVAAVYQTGLPGMLIQLRAAAAIVVVVKVAELVRGRPRGIAKVHPKEESRQFHTATQRQR